MTDCLLVHVPKFQNRYRPLGDYTSTQWMALGIFALADACEKEGLRARIIHLGLEKALDPRFRLSSYLKERPARLVAFSLHFHQQLYDTLRAARAVKESAGDTFVVTGGMTASFFAREILARFPEVDAVVAGEGEIPLARLASALAAGEKDLSGIPNLLWRRGGEIVENAERYVASRDDLDRMDFCNLSLMEHHRAYVGMPKIFSRISLPAAARWRLSKILSQKERKIFFALPVGRGCVTNCFYCGGGVRAHRIVNARKRPVFRSPERILDSVRELMDYGYEGAYVSFDPLPLSDGFYRSLFARFRSEGVRFDLPFSSWALPSPAFIEEYGKTFSPRSYVALSPETGSERLRNRARGIYFSNEDLIARLELAERVGVRTVVFFSLGIPGETPEDFDETLRLKREIEAQFTRASVDIFSIEIEPCAPWHLDPDRYGIVLSRRSLEDFIEEQKSPSYSSMTSLGYYRRRYLGREMRSEGEYAKRLLGVKCRYFCPRRRLCGLANIAWAATRLLRLSSSSDVPL